MTTLHACTLNASYHYAWVTIQFESSVVAVQLHSCYRKYLDISNIDTSCKLLSCCHGISMIRLKKSLLCSISTTQKFSGFPWLLIILTNSGPHSSSRTWTELSSLIRVCSPHPCWYFPQSVRAVVQFVPPSHLPSTCGLRIWLNSAPAPTGALRRR